MRLEYNIVGLDCAHCALTLEKYIEKINGVNSVNVNFSTSKLFIEVDDNNYKEIIKDIFKVTKQVNPDVKISKNQENESSIQLYDIILYVFGIIIGCFVIFIDMNLFLYFSLLIVSALCLGYRTYWKAIIQLRYFKINENTLITISILGAILIGESMEGLMVIALYTIGKFLESKAVNYSRQSISTLINNQPDYAVVIDGENEKKVKPELVKINDLIIVRPGEKVALDGVIVLGNATINKSHLTGESEPVVVNEGDMIASGCIVLDSAITIKVTSEYKDCTVSKILNLVSNASAKKSKTESIISKIASWYTLGVIISSILVFGIVWAIMGDIYTAIYRGLIFLVVSCPCAFAISVPLTYFSGIGRCSKQGILIKGSNFIDTCANANTIVFDKTGTLTTGKFVVDKVVTFDGFSKKKLMDIVVAGEKNSLHPIAIAICEHYRKDSKLKVKDFEEISGQGIKYTIDNKTYFVGKQKSTSGSTVVVVNENEKEIGKIYLSDKIKDESKSVIYDIKSLGLKTLMLTGDSVGVAKKVAKTLQIDDYKAGLMPQDKFSIIENKKAGGERIAFVGDGLNDAPALTLSHVGISMGIMGSDATIEASDVVIADDNLKQIPNLIKISRKTKKIALGNIIFAGLTKLTFLTLGAFGVTGMLFAVFADVGVTLLAIINSLRVLVYKIK